MDLYARNWKEPIMLKQKKNQAYLWSKIDSYRWSFTAQWGYALLVLFVSLGITAHAMGARPEKKDSKEVSISSTEGVLGREGFSRIVEPLLLSVVNISTSKEIKQMDMDDPDVPLDSLPEFFQHFFKEYRKRQRPLKSRSLGSGFIIDYDKSTKEAYILTNNHIIEGADEITVRLHDEDKTEIKAEIVGSDARTDIALLKVKSSKELTSVKWGDSDLSKVGEWAIAIGNPFGLGSTVTAGIISTKGRELPIADYVEGYIQTDASINMGNSGGPLFNVDGQVIGINTAILAPTGGNIGIGFAIPSNVAQKVVQQLRELGHTRRGWLGAAVQKVTSEIAESVGLKTATGALIAKVFDESPAAKAGLKPGDIILKFNNKEIKSSHMLPRTVGETEIGKEVPVVIWRDEKEVTRKIMVGEFEKAEKEGLIDMKNKAPQVSTRRGKGVEVMGMFLSPIDEYARNKFKLDDKIKGVVIVGLDNDSKVAEIGLQPGDVISSINGQAVNTPTDVQKCFDEASKKDRSNVLILLTRRGESRFISLPFDETTDKKTPPKSKEKKESKPELKNDEQPLSNDDSE